MVGSVSEFATKLRSEKPHPIVQTEGALREIHDVVTEMMKQLANEPSVGLYFVQQHVHKAVPAMVSLKAQMVNSTQEIEYTTQDVKDALNSVKSMTEVGPPVLERMIQILDSSLPHVASLRPFKSTHLDPSEHQNNSPRSSKFSSVEQNNQTGSSSSSAGTQGQNNSSDSHRMSSAEVLIEKEVSGNPITEGPYAGYMRTVFGSALQRASSATVANLGKWNSFTTSGKPDSTSTLVKEYSCPEPRSEVDAGKAPCLPSRSDETSAMSARPRDNASDELIVPSAAEEKLAIPLGGSESQKSSSGSLAGSFSLPTFRQVSDFGKQAQYVRTLLVSARQTLDHRGRETESATSSEASAPLSKPENQNDRWSWFQTHSKGARSLNGQPHSKGSLPSEEVVGDATMNDQNISVEGSKEDVQRLLEMESASFSAFAEEKAAKLEEWLEDTEETAEKERE